MSERDKYAPSMDHVRNMYARIMKPDGTVALAIRRQKEFDRALAAHDRALREQIEREVRADMFRGVRAWVERFSPGDRWDQQDAIDLESALLGIVEANPDRSSARGEDQTDESDTTPRDQLAQIINEHMEADVPETVADKHEPVDADYAMADAIIAAGFRPPARVVTTVEELDALPVGSIVRDVERAALDEKWDDNTWAELAYERTFFSRSIRLHATVIYEPKEGE